MTNLIEELQNLNVTSPLLSKKGRFVVEETLGVGLLFAAIFKKKPANYALAASNQYAAQRLYEFLLNFLDEEQIVFFPSDELLRAEQLTSSRELLSQRLYAMGQLCRPGPKVLITHPSALLRYLPSKKRFMEEVLTIKVGDHLDLKQLKSHLVDMGYGGQNKVEHSLQFASRGDILDIYSVSYLNPVRIEFFDDEIESIRLFDIGSQTSKKQLTECVILPATDIFLSDEELSEFMHNAKKRLEDDKKLLSPVIADTLETNVELDFEDFVTKNYKQSLYKYYGYALGQANSILDYLDPEITFVCNKPQFDESSAMLIREADEYLSDLFLSGRVLSRLTNYMSPEQAFKKRCVLGSNPFATSAGDIIFQAHKISMIGRNIASIVPTIQSYLSTNSKVVLCLPEPHQKAAVLNFLADAHIEHEGVAGFDLPEGKLAISDISLSEGFEIPSLKIAYLSSSELFGHRIVASRFTSRFKNATILKSYEELKPGDYVVHEYHGIGQFIDIQTLEVDGVHRDLLHIAYANNEYLYVPLEQFRLVRKYAGREGASPKLSRLSSGEWEKRKTKIKERVNELADKLINLYGERARISGYAFPPDDELQEQFEAEFPYELTDDQSKAVEDIKNDMERPEPMDRLVCGDVGFGKTEVAFRAAFKAINSGKQVALLCPTTLLARQHYEVAQQRFASFGIKMALFSRLVPASEQKKSMDAIAKGEIDLAIGTHRLLSKEIEFKNLGLLIVDEEQRFGVEQKERIKEMKRNVDVLTLSATPIPRTLQMSLVGIRPLSEINTAPSSRMPIQTYVVPFKQEAVDELVQRELARHGQVFYVHNKVETIYAIASKLAARIPTAEVGVVHGQMDKEDIEDVMERFYDGQLNVLVCTSIVENGIDIPNANMIIVENADTFGLSQLYQIKGRVGRGNRIAYAYLMYNARKDMKEDGRKRLQAIQEFTELGSGYKIAQRDLMIRGAGDILGPEQAGFIDSVGLDLYLKLLHDAVENKRTGQEPPAPVAKKLFNIDAYIPKEYAVQSDKIQLYQALEDVKDDKQLAVFGQNMKDVYGKIPKEVELLIQKKRIDLLTEEE
nr:transcription-repair coupling factor [Bacilli bacterium]